TFVLCTLSLHDALPIFSAQVAVCKIHKPLPVVSRHVVHTGPDVVADGAHHGLADRRHFFGSEPVSTEQAVDGVGMQGTEEFPFRSEEHTSELQSRENLV